MGWGRLIHQIVTDKGREMLSLSDMFNHEFIHWLAVMNGEVIVNGETTNAYYYNGRIEKEIIPKEEAATIYLGRPASRKMQGYIYPAGNSLRFEQGKSQRKNYNRVNIKRYV